MNLKLAVAALFIVTHVNIFSSFWEKKYKFHQKEVICIIAGVIFYKYANPKVFDPNLEPIVIKKSQKQMEDEQLLRPESSNNSPTFQDSLEEQCED